MTGYRKPKSEVVRALHIAMIILCTLASVAIFFLESVFNRVIISAMMIAYALFLLKNSHILQLIFQLPSNESRLFPIQPPQTLRKCTCGTQRNQQMIRTQTSKNKRQIHPSKRKAIQQVDGETNHQQKVSLNPSLKIKHFLHSKECLQAT